MYVGLKTSEQHSSLHLVLYTTLLTLYDVGIYIYEFIIGHLVFVLF